MDECRGIKEKTALLLRLDGEAVLLRRLDFLESFGHDCVYVEVIHMTYQAGVFIAVDLAPGELAFSIERDRLLLPLAGLL